MALEGRELADADRPVFIEWVAAVVHRTAESAQKRAAALETARGVAAPGRGAAPHPRDRAVTGPPGEQAERAASLTEESALRPENLPDAAYIAAGHVDDAQAVGVRGRTPVRYAGVGDPG